MIESALLPGGAPGFLAGAALALSLAFAVAWAPWRRALCGDAAHRFFACSLAIALLWLARADVGHGIGLQLVGVPLVTLMLGPALAIICAAVAALILVVFAELAPAMAAINVLFLGVVPALLVDLGRRAVAQWLPANPFVYLFGAGFFVTGAAAALAQLAAAAWMSFGLPAGAVSMFGQAAPYILLIGAGEATLSGMLVTLMVVYLPSWLATFKDAHYAIGKP